MKKLTIVMILLIIAAIVFVVTKFWLFSPDFYLSKKVLETAVPFDVKIDTELLKSLKPANE